MIIFCLYYSPTFTCQHMFEPYSYMCTVMFLFYFSHPLIHALISFIHTAVQACIPTFSHLHLRVHNSPIQLSDHAFKSSFLTFSHSHMRASIPASQGYRDVIKFGFFSLSHAQCMHVLQIVYNVSILTVTIHSWILTNIAATYFIQSVTSINISAS